eukprot:gene27776-7413_t
MAKLYVGNLSWDTQKDDLFQLFAQFGTVEDAFIPNDRETGRPRGFGFVTFSTPEEAQKAVVQLNETEFMGRTIRVNEAQAPGGGGGGGGYGGGGRGGGGGGYQQGGGGGGYGGGGQGGGYGGQGGGYGGQGGGGGGYRGGGGGGY